MKYFILAFSVMMGSAVADVQEAHVLFENEAQITLADPKRPGSTTNIEIDGKTYPLGAVSEQSNGVKRSLGQLLKTHGGRSFNGKAVGIIVNDKGFLPNPNQEMEVFQALYLEFALPSVVQGPGKPVDKRKIIRFPNKKGSEDDK